MTDLFCFRILSIIHFGIDWSLDFQPYHFIHLLDEQLQAKENGHGDSVAIELLCRHGELDAALAAVGQTRTEARQVCW